MLIDLIHKFKLEDQVITFSVNVQDKDLNCGELQGSCTQYMNLTKNGMFDIIFKDDESEFDEE